MSKHLGTIFNNDINNILCAMDASKPAGEIAEDYRGLVRNILAAKPHVLAQDVGDPDFVTYPTSVATTFDKHAVDVSMETWRDVWSRDGCEAEPVRKSHQDQADALRKLMEIGADPLTITIQECRKEGVTVIANYRMNAEDWYMHQYKLSDFGRAHPQWRIPLSDYELNECIKYNFSETEFTGALDPAVPEVFNYRMAVFREVAERYDIDGIEFDWRRWTHMISKPLENYPVLTRMVRETRAMLDEVAQKKGRGRMLLGVRVGPILDGEFRDEELPGSVSPGADLSCEYLGLDVRTWIAEGLVDYVCPTLFWPRWPGLPRTREFVELAKGTNVGIYPTLFALPPWLEESWGSVKGLILPDDLPTLKRYKEGFCELANRIYADGADGISTFNWYFHHYPYGGHAVAAEVLSVMGDRTALAKYCG